MGYGVRVLCDGRSDYDVYVRDVVTMPQPPPLTSFYERIKQAPAEMVFVYDCVVPTSHCGGGFDRISSGSTIIDNNARACRTHTQTYTHTDAQNPNLLNSLAQVSHRDYIETIPCEKLRVCTAIRLQHCARN